MLGRSDGVQPTRREADARLVRENVVRDTPEELVELNVVGESYRQDALATISGAKAAEGKHFMVGATLRCEPTNEYDANAVRVEVMGQHVGYLAREQAAIMCPSLQRVCGGALEARGLI